MSVGQNVDSQLSRPVIIIGAPRSGTTILGRILQNHKDLVYVEEPRLLWRYGNDGKSDMLRASDARPEVVAHIRGRFAEMVAKSGRQRLLEKTPSNSLRMGFVDKVFPNAIFIHVLRDGVNSALSIKRFWEGHASGVPIGKLKERLAEIRFRQVPHYASELFRRMMPSFIVGKPVWGPRLPGIDGLRRDLELLEVCCLQWRMCTEAACYYGRSLPPHRYMECRLEEISPELVRRIMSFCQLSEDEEVLSFLEREFDVTQPGARKVEASDEELMCIDRWIAPTTQWLGF